MKKVFKTPLFTFVVLILLFLIYFQFHRTQRNEINKILDEALLPATPSQDAYVQELIPIIEDYFTVSSVTYQGHNFIVKYRLGTQKIWLIRH